jgi:pimeloyl-ACP methyl ester carboxylesterase
MHDDGAREDSFDTLWLLRHGLRPVLMTSVAHFSMLEDPAQVNRVLAQVVADFG